MSRATHIFRKCARMNSEKQIIETLLKAGWNYDPADGFIAHFGGIWTRGEGIETEYGFVSSGHHENRNGVVHGGALMAFADRALGSTARAARELEWGTTITLTCTFMTPLKIGVLASILPTVSRMTHKMAFLSGTIVSNEIPIMSAQGVWKVRPREKKIDDPIGHRALWIT
jgi:acyl-coenzyme A thioesterase PaaI-like protein